MSSNYLFGSEKDTRHKVFISYYHKDDEKYKYREKFEELFGHIFINKSVEEGDIAPDNSDGYIKRLIQQNYITDTSVLVVLISPKAYCRKHVDWEISAAVSKKVGGYSGLLGILLPEFQLTADGKYRYDDIPPRLADNVKTGYAKVYAWDWVCANESRIKSEVEEAFQARIDKADKIDNYSREQFRDNRCE